MTPVFLAANPAAQRPPSITLPLPPAPPPARAIAPVVSIRERRRFRNERRDLDRRVRNDGSPYGVDRRRGCDERGGDRREGAVQAGLIAADATPTPPAPEAGVESTTAPAPSVPQVRSHAR